MPIGAIASAVLAVQFAASPSLPPHASDVPSGPRVVHSLIVSGQDTIRRRRPVPIEYSDAYATRLRIHRVLSWAMLPLFAVQYASGSRLIDEGADAPGWARTVHGPTATATAVLFGANTVTGGLNLWESRRDPSGRARRWVHAGPLLPADAGVTATGLLADEAENSLDARRRHRAVAYASMGVSVAGWGMMYLWKE